jgi:5-methyltetrahydrofolate--homocysteine methyltransferase
MSSPFLNALRSSRVLLMDGAMGTKLQTCGLKEGARGELWNLTRPERVLSIHQAYVDAGADVILTNSFLANPEWVAPPDSVGEINRRAVELARHAAGNRCHILASIGPFSGASDRLLAMCSPFLGTAGLLMETWSDFGSAALFLKNLGALAGFCDCPVLLSVTYNREGLRDPSKTDLDPEYWAGWANQHKQIVALGVNCGREIDVGDCAEIIRRYRTVTELPLFARPNAGTPVRDGERWIYPRSPQEMAAQLPLLLEAGASMIGGCCGTTPAHIAAFRAVIDDWNRRFALE